MPSAPFLHELSRWVCDCIVALGYRVGSCTTYAVAYGAYGFSAPAAAQVSFEQLLDVRTKAGKLVPLDGSMLSGFGIVMMPVRQDV